MTLNFGAVFRVAYAVVYSWSSWIVLCNYNIIDDKHVFTETSSNLLMTNSEKTKEHKSSTNYTNVAAEIDDVTTATISVNAVTQEYRSYHAGNIYM